ncbi:hypothetical protein IWX90DRAFT_473927 [Phyllosticta citrichinensis]|uniref:Uncharacterized protein n=1 Tax=Phyllosticta citrichinensis TaxID=1130410 RepID=A0ABR1Y4S5_9PEZI
MDDDDPKLVRLLLSYCYLNDDAFSKVYSQWSRIFNDTVEQEFLPLWTSFSICASEDKYQVRDLVEDMSSEFVMFMQKFHWKPCACDETIFNNLSPSFSAKLAREVFQSTPRQQIRKFVLKYAARHITHLNRSQEFKDMLNDVEDFRDELLDHIGTYADQSRRCRSCFVPSPIKLNDYFNDTIWFCPECESYNSLDHLSVPTACPTESEALPDEDSRASKRQRISEA